MKEQVIGKEHWNVDNGDFKGLWAINPEMAQGADIWQKIDEIVIAYSKLNPGEVFLTILENKAESARLMHETGKTKGGTMRYGAAWPLGLWVKIKQLAPDLFLNKKNFHKLLRKYPGFTIAKKI